MGVDRRISIGTNYLQNHVSILAIPNSGLEFPGNNLHYEWDNVKGVVSYLLVTLSGYNLESNLFRTVNLVLNSFLFFNLNLKSLEHFFLEFSIFILHIIILL
jgi:hypothetical protein